MRVDFEIQINDRPTLGKLHAYRMFENFTTHIFIKHQTERYE